MPRLKKSTPSRPWMPSRVAQERRLEEVFDYNSTRWRKDRRLHLAANPLCVECQKEGFVTEATVSDHDKPIREGGDPWDWSNRLALCEHHHAKKSGREAHTRRGKGGNKV